MNDPTQTDTHTHTHTHDDDIPGTIEDKILHVLMVYPVLSWAMLRLGCGLDKKTGDIKDALNALLQGGKVVMTQTSLQSPMAQRTYTYDRYHLPDCPHITSE